MKCDICKKEVKAKNIGRGYGKFVCSNECFVLAGKNYDDKGFRPWTKGINT